MSECICNCEMIPQHMTYSLKNPWCSSGVLCSHYTQTCLCSLFVVCFHSFPHTSVGRVRY